MPQNGRQVDQINWSIRSKKTAAISCIATNLQQRSLPYTGNNDAEDMKLY